MAAINSISSVTSVTSMPQMSPVFRPNLAATERLSMFTNNPLHITPEKGNFATAVQAMTASGAGIVELGEKIGAEGALNAGGFESAMLRALDTVSGHEMEANNLVQAAIIDPDSIDPHDVTIAQSKAAMSLNIARTVLNRVVQGWRDIINTR